MTETIKFLSGSAEFWPDKAKDRDYIVIRQQDTFFTHERVDGDCYFCYRPVSKAEYFAWHNNVNDWYLNTAPFCTKAFLDYMGIDCFGADKAAVYAIMKKCFDFVYRNTPISRWNKYAYRVLLYWYAVLAGDFKFSEEQLDRAFALKKDRAISDSDIKGLYMFFGADEEEARRVICS